MLEVSNNIGVASVPSVAELNADSEALDLTPRELEEKKEADGDRVSISTMYVCLYV